MIRGGDTLNMAGGKRRGGARGGAMEAVAGAAAAMSGAESALVDTRATPVDDNPLPFNSTISKKIDQRIVPQNFAPNTAQGGFGPSITVRVEGAIGAPGQWLDLYNSKLFIRWREYQSNYAGTNTGGPVAAGATPVKFAYAIPFWWTFHSLLMFQQIFFYINDVLVTDGANANLPYTAFSRICLTQGSVLFGSNSGDSFTYASDRNCDSASGIVSMPAQNQAWELADLRQFWMERHALDYGCFTQIIDLSLLLPSFANTSFLPASANLRFQFDKSASFAGNYTGAWTGAVATPYEWPQSACQIPVNTTAPMQLIIEDIYLNLRRVTLTNAGLELTERLLSSTNLIYPMLRGITQTFAVPAGATAINQHIFGIRAPQAMSIHFVPTNSYQWSQKDFYCHPFTTSWSNKVSADSSGTFPINIVSLEVQTQGTKYPEMNPITRTPFATGNKNTYACGGTEFHDYERYANLTKQYADGKTDHFQPFLSRMNLADGNLMMIWFNLNPQQEPFLNRMQTSPDSTQMDILATLGPWNHTFQDGDVTVLTQSVDVTMIVTTWSMEVMRYDPISGRVGLSYQ